MIPADDKDGEQNRHITVPDTALGIEGLAPIIWQSANLARPWYEDALREAKDLDRGARRREILFAVAAAETYLFEWVRDDVLHHDYARLDDFFPPGSRTPIRDKWKDVPKELLAQKLIMGVPDLNSATWPAFCKLVDFRSGLIHGSASRPFTSGLPVESMPVPTWQELQALACGWAVGVVFDLVTDLNDAAGIKSPAWLRQP